MQRPGEPPPEVLPVGRHAVLLGCADAEQARALHDEVRRRVAAGELAAPVDLVPAATTLLVDGLDDPRGWVRQLLDATVADEREDASRAEEPQVVVDVVYDGPDLAAVAGYWGVPPEQVAERHGSLDHVVAFCGFAPGFAYVTGLPPELAVPRRPSPRERVPAGSVAVADRWTGVYPTASPGGWQLIGRTDAPLFNPDREPPALLRPGARVRFRAVERLTEPTAPAAAQGADDGPDGLEVVRAGPLTTVQDGGRPGHAGLAVPPSGALDGPAAQRANRLVGNPAAEAVLETTAGGCAVRARRDVWAAVTGALAAVRVGGRQASTEVPLRLRAGEVLEVGSATAGLRCYVAVSGGVRVRAVLGSRSSDLLSGLGPAVLGDGDVLPLGPAGPPSTVDLAPVAPPPTDGAVLHLDPGPRLDWLDDASRTALVTGAWTATASSNRVGLRLAGPRLVRDPDHAGELPSEGTVTGAVQVAADGQPIVFLADHPTTVGYPVVAVVTPSDLPLCAQLRPGTVVGLRWSSRGVPAR